MSRIRNVKPEFYAHEELQDMEIEHPELHPMLVFSALWTQCEWSGVFHWSIRKLKLAILPFLNYDLEKALCYLERHGFIKKFDRDGKSYGFVNNFTKYQAISGKEKEQELKYPVPTQEELDRNYTGTRQELDKNKTGSPDSDSDIGHKTKDKDINFPAAPENPEAAPPAAENQFFNSEKTEAETSETPSDGKTYGNAAFDAAAGPSRANTGSLTAPRSGQKSDETQTLEKQRPPPQKSADKPKKPPLREREPENGYERVEKAYLQNWDTLRGQGRVITPEPAVNWNQTRKLLKKHFEKLKPDQIAAALANGMEDAFVMDSGYSLGTMLSAGVLSRLINGRRGAPPPGGADRKSLKGLKSVFERED